MTRDIIKNKPQVVPYDFYGRKIRKYEVVYEEIVDRFFNDIYGDFWNRVQRDVFVSTLATEGWKYFTIRDLNTLFYVTIEKMKDEAKKNNDKFELLSVDDDDDYDDAKSNQYDLRPKIRSFDEKQAAR